VLDDDIAAEFVMAVLGAVPAVTFKTSVNVDVVLAPSDELVHVCVPPDAAGHVQPVGVDGGVIETTVVFAGNVSVMVTLDEVAGPLFVTTMV
jgi:hypothetical protein